MIPLGPSKSKAVVVPCSSAGGGHGPVGAHVGTYRHHPAEHPARQTAAVEQPLERSRVPCCCEDHAKYGQRRDPHRRDRKPGIKTAGEDTDGTFRAPTVGSLAVEPDRGEASTSQPDRVHRHQQTRQDKRRDESAPDPRGAPEAGPDGVQHEYEYRPPTTTEPQARTYRCPRTAEPPGIRERRAELAHEGDSSRAVTLHQAAHQQGACRQDLQHRCPGPGHAPGS